GTSSGRGVATCSGMVPDAWIRRACGECVRGDSMSRIGIIAAMERELHPLIGHSQAGHSQTKGWKRTSLIVEGHDVQCFENGDTVAAISGMGSKRAEATARAVVKKYQPEILI